MYRFEHDPRDHVYAGALSAGGDPNDDFGTHIEELKKAAAIANGSRLAVVVVMLPGHPVPSAAWRSKVGELMTSGELVADLAVLSSNPVIRGVLTAISWVASGDDVQFRMFGSWEAAEAWLEKRRGGSLGRLAELVKNVSDPDRPSQQAG
jgi:hypothetical protein